jgi:hypothetical protein
MEIFAVSVEDELKKEISDMNEIIRYKLMKGLNHNSIIPYSITCYFASKQKR